MIILSKIPEIFDVNKLMEAEDLNIRDRINGKN